MCVCAFVSYTGFPEESSTRGNILNVRHDKFWNIHKKEKQYHLHEKEKHQHFT